MQEVISGEETLEQDLNPSGLRCPVTGLPMETILGFHRIAQHTDRRRLHPPTPSATTNPATQESAV